MGATQIRSPENAFGYLHSVLRKVNSRRPEAAARLIDQQFLTADRVSSAYALLKEARRAKRQTSAFEAALAWDAAQCLMALDIKRLRVPFWWKYGTWVMLAVVLLTVGLGVAAYWWWPTSQAPAAVTNPGRFSPEIMDLRGMAAKLGEAANQAKQGDLAGVGEELISTAAYIDALAHRLGLEQLVQIGVQLKMAGTDLKRGNWGQAGEALSKAGAGLEALPEGDINFAEAGHAFAEAGRLLSLAAESPDNAQLKNLGIGLANDLLEAREVIMNATNQLQFYEDEQKLASIESSLTSATSMDDLLKNMAPLGEVLKDLNSHLVSQSIPLMERNIPWQDLANLEKMTSGWDDTWPFYVPAAKVPGDLGKSPSGMDSALSPADAKRLFQALTEASQAIASASQEMELVRVKSNPEDLAKMAQDLSAAAMALKETSKLARAVAGNYISSIKLNVPTSFEDLTMPTAKNIGQAWIYQQQEPNMGITDLWKARYVSSYYGSLGIAGDQLGTAGEMLGSAFGMWNKVSDIKAMQELKLGEEQLIGASRRLAMTLDNWDELRDLQNRATAVESYRGAISKMEKGLQDLEKAATPQAALKALSAELAALAEPFATTPMFKPDAYYLLDQAGRKLGLAAAQTGDQQMTTLNSAAEDISKASQVMFGTQEINLREYGQYLEEIATQLVSATAAKSGQYFLGPLRKVALDFRGLQELLGVQVKWEGQAGQDLANGLDRTLVMGTVLLRPVTGDEGAPSPNLIASYYVESSSSVKWPQLKYDGELLATPVVDFALAKSLRPQPGKDETPVERTPIAGEDIVRRYFLSLAQEGSASKNWIKKQVPVKPGQPHITVPPLPPDMPPRQPPSSGGGLHCPAVTSK